MTAYLLFVLRALITGQRMPADEIVADWAGVRRQALVLGRQRPGFFAWLGEELDDLLRAEPLDAAIVAAVKVPCIANAIETTRHACRQRGAVLRGARIRLGRRWLDIPALLPQPPRSTRHDVEPARPAAA